MQTLAQDEALTVTVADYVEVCRVTVNLLAQRRADLRESLSLFKGGMDVSTVSVTCPFPQHVCVGKSKLSLHSSSSSSYKSLHLF